jgi:hypothetical protein
MGAPAQGIKAPAEDSSAEVLLSKLENIAAAERRRHANVFNYWLSIRGDRHFPPIRDLDPLEISDAGPSSVLLELIGGGEDAEIRHLGQALKEGPKVESISEAQSPSLLSCIAKQLPVIANARQAIAFEDEYSTEAGTTRCWVTLLPFSSTGTYVDYVYGFVSQASDGAKVEDVAEVEGAEELAETESGQMAEDVIAPEPALDEDLAQAEPEDGEQATEIEAEVNEDEPGAHAVEAEEPVAEFEEPAPEAGYEEQPHASNEKRPGFSKFFDALAGVGNFYGNVVQMDSKIPSADGAEEPDAQALEGQEVEQEFDQEVELEVACEPEAAAAEDHQPELNEIEDHEPEAAVVEDHPIKHSNSAAEGSMQSKLADVRSKADEARTAKLRANAALYEGLSAAYDFALDAEENAEEYLKLVEAQGLKIQLRSPMKPVVKLAFDGLCDDATISQLETVLAWALKQDLARGSLAERIEAEGGLGAILNGKAAA